MSKKDAMAFIDIVQPTHTRTSCDENSSYNAAFVLDDRLHNYCERCTLIRIAELALGEIDSDE